MATMSNDDDKIEELNDDWEQKLESLMEPPDPPLGKHAFFLSILIVIGTFWFVASNRPIDPHWPLLIPFGAAVLLYLYGMGLLSALLRDFFNF